MALIAMAVYSTAENKKDDCLSDTLCSLEKTVDFSKHRLILSVNGYTDKTSEILMAHSKELDGIISKVIYNEFNIGTAEAINKAWRYRNVDENAIKMDDDVVIHQKDWIGQMEDAISRDASIGICGLKRKDCIESPEREDFYKSELYMLPHNPGQSWIVGEVANHVMGTCQMYSAALLEKIGFLFQNRLYGFDDSLAAVRCKLAGFKSIFLPSINIDHIDGGDTPYQKWKENHASEQWQEYHKTVLDYNSGEKSIYYNPFK